MNKDQFRLQIYHNRFTRGVVVTICKIALSSIVYALVISILTSILVNELGDQFGGVTPDNFPNNIQFTPLTIGVSISILILTICYYWYVIAAILRKIKQNKAIRAAEDAFLSGDKTTLAKD